MDLCTAAGHAANLRENLRRVIRGKDDRLDLALTALLAGGSILMEDVPGVGKTTLAKAIARSLDADFRRVQFTPDLLPADVKALAAPVLAHRLTLTPKARYAGVDKETLVRELVDALPAPR